MARPYNRRTPNMTTRGEARAKPADDSFAGADDAALGIDEPASAGELDMDALMAHPSFAALVDKAVSARMGQSAERSEGGSDAAFKEFLSKFEHLTQVRDEQRPGYQKPLTAEEMDERRAGHADMIALLKRFKAENVWPFYLLSDESNPFYGPSAKGDILYEAGQEIYTRLPPSEGFVPQNDAAREVFSAYKRWIGEPVSIEELTARAVSEARGEVPQMVQREAIAEPEVRLAPTAKRDVGAKRTLGTITPEMVGVTMPRQPGVAAQPQGPVFVGEG